MSLFDVVTPNQVRQRWKGTLDRDTVEDFSPTPDAYLLHALKPDAKDIDEEPSWRKSYHGCMDRVDVWRKAYCPCCGTPPTKSDRCCPTVIGVCTSSIAVVSNSVLLALGVYSFVRSEWTDSNASITMAIMACSSPYIPELANFTRANCASELLVSCGSSFAGPNIPDLTTNPLTLAYRQQLHMVGFTILLLGAAALISLVTLFLQAQIQRRQKLAALLLPFYLFLRHERLPFAGGKGMPPMEREGLCCGCARRGGCLCSSQETLAAHDADAQAAAEAAAKVAAVTSAPDGSGSTNTSTSKASQGSHQVTSNLLCSCSRALDVRCCGRGVQLTTILPQLSLVFVIFIAYYAGKYLSINAILFNTSRAPYTWNSKTLWRVEATCTLANGTTNAPMTYLLDIGAAQATLAAGGAQVLGFPAFLVAIVLILVAFVPQLAQIYSADGDVLSGVSLRGFVHCVGAEKKSGLPCPHHSLHSQGGLQQGGGGAAEVVTLGQWGGGTSTLHPSRFAAVEERDLNAQLWVLLEQLQEAQSRRSECHCSGTLCLWLAFFTWPFKDHPGKSRAVGRLILETAWKKALLSERSEDMGVFVDALQKVRRENRARREEEEEEEEKEKEKGKGKGGESGLFSNNPMRVAQASAGIGSPPVPLRGRVEEEGVIQTSTPRPTTTTTTTTTTSSLSSSFSSSSSSSSLAPKIALQPPSVVLPPHWEREGPDEEGEYWYFNTETEESQWEVPTV